jgi:AGZA family xanthine/uracil permease-like MFS transporter
MTGGKLEFSALSNGDVWVALITFLYLDFLDATNTMFTMARIINDKVPGFMNKKGQWPRQCGP